MTPALRPGVDLWSRALNRTYGSFIVSSATALFSKLGDDRFFHWTPNDLWLKAYQGGIGVGIGIGTFGMFVLIARTLYWVSFPSWGWQKASIEEVATSLVTLAIYYLAVAVTEEIIFRGYAFQQVQLALGSPAAAVLLTALFARAHGSEPLSLIGQTASGVLFMALRLTSGSLWMPVGCHFGVSYAQTALMGPTDGAPSLLPLENHGPKAWLGRPGYPEPGIITAIAYLLATAAVVAG